MKEPTRSEGELVRLKHLIARMRTTMQSLESAMSHPGIPFGDTGVSVTANELVTCLARHDAYLLAEGDAKGSR